MSGKKDLSACVFITNIPIDVSESYLQELFSSCGKIVSFEFDTASNRQAICQYLDADIAQAAIKTYNGHLIRDRQLYVSQADSARLYQRTAPNHIVGSQAYGLNEKTNAFQRMAQGAYNAVDDEQIRRSILALSDKEQAEILCEFRSLAATHPEQVRQLLTDSPPFAHAILCLMTMYQFVDQDVITEYQIKSQLSPEEIKLLERWRALPEIQRQKYRVLLDMPIDQLIKPGQDKAPAQEILSLKKLQQRGIKL